MHDPNYQTAPDSNQAAAKKLPARLSFMRDFTGYSFTISFLAGVVFLFTAWRTSLAPSLVALSVVIYVIHSKMDRKCKLIEQQNGPNARIVREKERIAREIEKGLRETAEDDIRVASGEWTSKMSEMARWAHGEPQSLLDGDTVVRFCRITGPLSGRGGYGIVRGRKVVAEFITLRA